MKLKSYESRQQHLVDKHKFSTSFKFRKEAHPSKQERHKRHIRQTHNRRQDTKDVDVKANFNHHQKHRQKHSSHQREEVKAMDMEVEESVDKLASAVSMLTTSDSTPSSISFGHRHARGLTFIPRSVQKSKNHVESPNAKMV